MRSKSILSGVNVPITPTSNAETKLTNNITISNVAYPSVTTDSNPYKDVVETAQQVTQRDVQYSDKTPELEAYLLKLYQSILLSDNKKLISNVVTKDSIILTQEDLEKIIEYKTGKKCVIKYEDPETECCGINTIFMKISSIRIVEKDDEQADFKIKYNKDYLELMSTYHLNLKYVLIN